MIAACVKPIWAYSQRDDDELMRHKPIAQPLRLDRFPDNKRF